MTSLTAIWIGVAVGLLTSCGKDAGSSESTSTEETPTIGDVGSQPGSTGGDGGTTGGTTGESPGGGLACGELLDGETKDQTMYRAATVVAGVAECESETQTFSCSNGVISHTGSFLAEGCVKASAQLAQGDVLVLREDSGDGIGDAGQVMAFSQAGEFKGYAFDSAGIVPWYAYGLKLSFDYFSDRYHVELGSSNADLAIQVKRFPTVAAYPYRLESPENGPVSDAQYFQGAFSEEYNSVRYVATSDGATIKIYNFGTEVPDCAIAMPAGKYARAFFSGTQGFFYDGYVAYTLGSGVSVTGYGVARLNGSCSSAGGTPETLVTLFEDTVADAKITSLLQVRTTDGGGAGSWKNDLFVTVGTFLYGQTVVQWHYDSGSTTWVKQANAFEDIPRAIYQDNTGDVYTVELEDLFNDALHLRRYRTMDSESGHFVSTLYSDPTQQILRDTALGQWLLVMPTLP